MGARADERRQHAHSGLKSLKGSPWLGLGLELIASLSTAILFLAWSRTVDVNPLDRLGQVSGLAQLQFRFAVFSVVLIAAVILAAKLRGGRALAMTLRIACAAAAGLATG